MNGTNCYLVGCPKIKKCIVIDPGDEPQKVYQVAQDNGYQITAIVNTHGHYDHIGGNKTLKELTGAPIYIHQADADSLIDKDQHLGHLMGKYENSPPADKMLQEGDIIEVGEFNLKVIHTPGHTPGGMTLVGDNLAFVGDTLFAGSVGRTDLPGGNYGVLMASIKDKLLSLDDEVMILPGHGPSTTMGQEKKTNPFILELML